ncbi:hypothetical protein IPV09_11080 [Tessaracoccus sp. SD287]|uniref:hypothetical protein n=1 Tax=Tessaracoccus sp. SD287 TaxID=2782008 RepID=UPI001A97D2C1|nr:hypothetical protein [Tessaracoccus sp. SD287]MBO1031877.1 hypothetical protein [Tessaracoccus sp. SD287]
MLNLEKLWRGSSFEVDASPVSISEYPDMNRTAQTWLSDASGSAETVAVSNDMFDVKSGIGADMTGLFRDHNVCVTMNRDNHLVNIRDWVLFNVRINGATAFLIYDNQSRRYTTREILDALSDIKGAEVIVIVEWPHKFGPLGGPQQQWDSDFGQYTAWEHSRWRFLTSARAVQVGDVDELVLANDLRSCFDLALAEPSGVLYYYARNVVPVPRTGADPNAEVRRHGDCTMHNNEGRIVKYTYVPAVLDPVQQLKLHAVTYANHPKSEDVVARHCLNVHLRWRIGSHAYTFPYRSPQDGDEQDLAFESACDLAYSTP